MQVTELEILRQLRQQGYRVTAPRRAVVSVLQSAEAWLPPDAVHARAAEICPSIGLVTVYRTLALLTELQLAQRVHWEGGCHGYALGDVGHGHHLVCQQCHKVVAFADCDLSGLVKTLESETGFRIEAHVLELVGVCPSCQG